MDFDYGYEEGVVQGGSSFVKNEKIPAEGEHMARISSIIHLGLVETFYLGESKGVNPRCVVEFELMEDDDFETDGESRLLITKDIDIKKGEKANITLLRQAFNRDDGSDITNFDEFIGAVGTVNVIHSKCGKYANVAAFNKGGISSLHRKLWATVPDATRSLGNIKFDEMTVEALERCHAYNHVRDMMMISRNYEGSQAQKCVEQIRAMEGREAYATYKEDKPAPNSKAAQMDENEEY